MKPEKLYQNKRNDGGGVPYQPGPPKPRVLSSNPAENSVSEPIRGNRLPEWYRKSADAAAALVNPNTDNNLKYRFYGGNLPRWAQTNFVRAIGSTFTPARSVIENVTKYPDTYTPSVLANLYATYRKNWLRAYERRSLTGGAWNPYPNKY